MTKQIIGIIRELEVRLGRGRDDRRGPPSAWDFGTELLSIAARILRPEAGPSEAFQEPPRGKEQLKKAAYELTLAKLILKEALQEKL